MGWGCIASEIGHRTQENLIEDCSYPAHTCGSFNQSEFNQVSFAASVSQLKTTKKNILCMQNFIGYFLLCMKTRGSVSNKSKLWQKKKTAQTRKNLLLKLSMFLCAPVAGLHLWWLLSRMLRGTDLGRPLHRGPNASRHLSRSALQQPQSDPCESFFVVFSHLIVQYVGWGPGKESEVVWFSRSLPEVETMTRTTTSSRMVPSDLVSQPFLAFSATIF